MYSFTEIIAFWTALEFEWWQAVFLLPLPLILQFLSQKNQNDELSVKLPFFTQLEQSKIFASEVAKSINFKQILLWLMWFSMIAALTKPVWIDEAIKQPLKGRDIVLSVDLSGSMKEQDFALNGRRVNRLAVVKNAAKLFVKARKNDRLGLVVFGDKAYLYSPLTFDKSLILQYLDEATIGLAGQKTALYDSIVLTIKHFRDNKKGDDETRVLILLTDGVDSREGIGRDEAVSLAVEEHIKIYTIGIGQGGGFFRQGVDEGALKHIAKRTGGAYFRAKNTEQLRHIYREIDKLERQKLEQKTYRPRFDLFFYPLSFALLFFTILVIRKCY